MAKALLREAAPLLGLTEHALRQMAKAGQIPHIRIGCRYVFDVPQCQDWLRQKALENVKQFEKQTYGVIRRVQ